MKQVIKLTESDLHRIIKETVSILLKEEDDYKSPLQRAIDNIGFKVVGKIDYGLVILVGFTDGDSEREIDYLVDKVINLRIFDDDDGVMNKSLVDVVAHV